MATRKKILCIVGARPNFMKIAPIMEAFKKHSDCLQAKLLHTGQHYDAAMKHSFFDQLGIPEPDIDLEVGSGSHAVQTAEIMKRFEPVLDEQKPGAILVVGDVNSTIACALVAAKKGISIIHVEAGLRSYDRAMPEEINRILTDQISDLLFTTEREAEENLAKEGISSSRIHFVGNVMIDTLRSHLPRAVAVSETFRNSEIPEAIAEKNFALLTLHRPSNVDNASTLERLLECIGTISNSLPVIFPVHPRTRAKIKEFGLDELISDRPVYMMGPLGYLQLLGVMSKAKLVLTDSGGIQEETTALGVPCITLRENTERPITVTSGTNTVVGTDREKILGAFSDVMKTGGKAGRIPELWDGHAAERILTVIKSIYC